MNGLNIFRLGREFKVNDFITLKLKEGETVIYITGERVFNCKKVAINIPIGKNFQEFDDKILKKIQKADSVDELEEIGLMDFSDDNPKQRYISEETEFFVHCSNIQAWVENQYDTRMLHSNLSFPLLKKLAEAGDPIAKINFKEEIAKRFKKGTPSVIKYLLKQGYLNYLNEQELEMLDDVLKSLRKACVKKIRDPDIFKYLKDLVVHHGGGRDEREDAIEAWQKLVIDEENKQLRWMESDDISPPSYYFGLASSLTGAEWATPFELKIRALIYSGEFGCLTQDDIDKLPELKTVKSIRLRGCYMQSLPENIGCFTSAEELLLSYNFLTELPQSIGNLKSLKDIDLTNNLLTSIPHWVLDLPSLEWLGVYSNPLDDNTVDLLKTRFSY